MLLSIIKHRCNRDTTYINRLWNSLSLAICTFAEIVDHVGFHYSLGNRPVYSVGEIWLLICVSVKFNIISKQIIGNHTSFLFATRCMQLCHNGYGSMTLVSLATTILLRNITIDTWNVSEGGGIWCVLRKFQVRSFSIVFWAVSR